MAQSATIRVDRTFVGFRDRFRAYKVLIDGVRVGQVKNGEAFECSADPGVHHVRLKVDWVGSPEVTVNVPPGATAVLAASAKPRKGGLTMMVEASVGRHEYILLEARSDDA